MNAEEAKSISKFLSLVLRHEPEAIGLTLDAAGWASVRELLDAAGAHGRPISEEQLAYVVENNDKKRFTFSDDGSMIRAQQGHSVMAVDLQYQPVIPPDRLFHGTATRFVEAIRSEGLRPMSRQHVHLSGDTETATKVGQRHGKPIVLTIDAAAMYRDGCRFYVSPNGVWLTEVVGVSYIRFD